jgi:tRNA A37 threonylcarbamoyladenosine dehydratase
MLNQFSRTQLLVGASALEVLAGSSVAIFGIGGVGGYTVEALARSGVGTFHLVDDDRICLTNLNRQVLATRDTVGQFKVDVARDRILSINPNAQVNVYKTFFAPDTADQFDFASYDYVVDAIDTVTGKIALVLAAQAAGTPILSSMGTGNKMDPTGFMVADIYDTSVCPLARVMRRELKKRGVPGLKVVYSQEMPITPLEDMSISCRAHCICPPGTARKCTQRRQVPGSNAYVPATAGLLIAAEVVKDLTKNCQR